MSTLTDDQRAAIARTVDAMHLPAGLGDRENACSVAAINLALFNALTDGIPDCMSQVVGCWIIGVQDVMPDAMRNSKRWKAALPLAAGTGRRHELERLDLVYEWMWTRVLPFLQTTADVDGYGAEWREMIETRTLESRARAAQAVGLALSAMEIRTMSVKVQRSSEVIEALIQVKLAMKAAFFALRSARALCQPTVTRVAAHVAVAQARYESPYTPVWEAFDPCGLLERLIEVSE